MKKIFLTLILILAAISFSNLNAQVTIGSNSVPNAGAVLDIISGANKGLLMPRVALTSTRKFSPVISTDGTLNTGFNVKHTEGMTVYNTATDNSDTGYEVSPGYYYNDGTKWVRLPQRYTNWFFMPSVSFDTSTTGTGRTKNLYDLYLEQFTGKVTSGGVISGTPTGRFVGSTGAPATIPYVPAATDMYYYVTYYDTTVFANISINASGLMTYDVIAGATDCSYINIVFVLK